MEPVPVVRSLLGCLWSVGLFIPKEDLTAGTHHTVNIMAGDHRRGDEGKLVPPNKDVSAGSQDFLPLSLRSWFWFPNDLTFCKDRKVVGTEFILCLVLM